MNDTNTNERQIIRCSSYYDFDKFNDFAKKNNNCFSILSTNIKPINAKFSELEAFVEELKSIHLKFSVICLQGSWTNNINQKSK